MQFRMLNLKKLLLESGKKKEAENYVRFEEDLLFSKNNTPSAFRISDWKKKFTKAKK